MLAQCVTLTEVALLSKMMGCKQHLLWHMNWVSRKRSMILCLINLWNAFYMSLGLEVFKKPFFFIFVLQATSSTCLMMMLSCAPASTVPTGAPTWWPPPCQTWTSSSRGPRAPPSWSPPSWTTAMVSACWINRSNLSNCPSRCPARSMTLTISVGWPLARTPSTAQIWAPRVQLCGALWLHPTVCWCARPRIFPGLMEHHADTTATAWLDSVSPRTKQPNTRWEWDPTQLHFKTPQNMYNYKLVKILQHDSQLKCLVPVLFSPHI